MQIVKETRHPLYELLVAIVGAKHVADEDFARYATSTGGSCFPGLTAVSPLSDKFGIPDVVVKPRTTDHVVRIVKLANRTRTPLTPRGGGEGVGGGADTPYGGILLDMTDMNKIIEIDEANMAVRVQAGITWGTLLHELAKKGYRLGVLGPHGAWGATIGAGIAVDTACRAAHKYGSLQQDVLGLQVVLPNGDMIETGGLASTTTQTLLRYVNGPDIAGLFIGSCGTLGVITEAVLRFYAKPDYIAHATYGFDSNEKACRALYELSKFGYVEEYLCARERHTVDLLYPGVPERIQSLFGVATETFNEKELEMHTNNWKETAKKYDGEDLDPKWAEAVALDPRCESFGGVIARMHGNCHAHPLLRVPETNDAFIRLFKEHEDIIAPFPGTDTPGWLMTCMGCFTNPISDVTDAFMYDPTDPEIRRKAYGLWLKTLELAAEQGCGMHWIAKIGYVDNLMSRTRPEYFNLLRTLKKALDPNNIMNPGIWRL